ncbi:MAG: hypothetical protein ACTHU0_33235 [Kofleriaceae bacterium]
MLWCALAACSDEVPPLRDDKPTAPDTNDPAYQVGVVQWYLTATGATPAHDAMPITVAAPSGTDVVDAWAGDLPPLRLTRNADGAFVGEISLAELPVGSYELLLAADGSTRAFARIEFHRSAPYFVVVSTDWDFSDPGQRAIGYQDMMHADHPDLRLTHFVGPYTFTDPAITPARQTELVSWLVRQRDMFRDEIGLHIHPYCHFVESAGVTCVTDQSTVYAEDLTGYTIKVAAYGRTEMGRLLAHSIELFGEHGIGRPRTFRAGGWTATLDTLKALADQGFTADTSALNWARLDEWKDVQSGELYRWNMEHWAPIGDTSQPYWPSENDVLTSEPPTLPILEVPDNGIMIDYVTLSEMNGLFDTNWNGRPLDEPVTLMMGFHPAPGFSAREYAGVDGFLDYADQHLATRGLGPVLYITLEDLVAAYAR